MSNELAIRPNLEETMTLAKAFVESGFFTDAKSQAQAIVKILAGQELGFGPMASMTGVYIVKGKVSLSANLMAAALKRSGRYNYRVKTLTDNECVIEFYERSDDGWEPVGQSAFSIEDAKKAGLTSNHTWKQYPRNMLFARALSNGVRWYCPDIFGGPLYTPEELGAPVNAEGEPVQFVDAKPVYHTNNGVEVMEAEFREETARNVATYGSGKPGSVTRAQLKKLHALGHKVYGDDWDAKRADILGRKGLNSSKELSKNQASKWIEYLQAQVDDTEPDAMEAEAAMAEARAA